MKLAYVLGWLAFLSLHAVFAAPVRVRRLGNRSAYPSLTPLWKSTHLRIRSETIGDADKQSVTHTYNDPEHGPTKIEVTKVSKPGRALRMHKKVFHKPHAGADWVPHPEKDEIDEEISYNFKDTDGRHHVVRHRGDSDMWTDHVQTGGSLWKYGFSNRRVTRYVNGEKKDDGHHTHLKVGSLEYGQYVGTNRWGEKPRKEKYSGWVLPWSKQDDN